MGKISELEAVNHMLLMAGESSVADLTGIDATTALELLTRHIQDHLMRGLVGNRTVTDVKLAAAGTIDFTESNILSAELLTTHTNDDGYVIQGTVRGNYGTSPTPQLFNITDQTLTWDAGVTYTIEKIFELNWEDIDTPLQRGIMAAAARQYQIVMQGDADADAYLAQAEVYYLAKAKAANTDDRRNHLFNQFTVTGRDAISRGGRVNDPARFRFWRHS